MNKKFENRESVVLENAGQKIFGVIHRPLQKGVVPCVLFCHGLAGHKCGRYRVYVELAEELSKNGIAVLRIDFRGCGDSEGEFGEMTLSGELSDAHLALQFLTHDSGIDKNRIGFFGRSLGGVIAILAASAFHRANSLALWAPIFNGDQWKNYWKLAEEKLASDAELQEMRRINGQVASFQFFEELFNIKIIDALQNLQHVPMIHIHGERDSVVNIHHAEEYEKERQKAQAVSKFIRLPNGDHEFSHPGERVYAIHETVNWFKETL